MINKVYMYIYIYNTVVPFCSNDSSSVYQQQPKTNKHSPRTQD